ncbi:MAG: WD40 repeat domain-containing protein [Synechococcales cyanobacterium RM1_1_8]|nr:WD40 repeat domain-containing protein [Synechococcales cyanobacterium RM1_1_8]
MEPKPLSLLILGCIGSGLIALFDSSPALGRQAVSTAPVPPAPVSPATLSPTTAIAQPLLAQARPPAGQARLRYSLQGHNGGVNSIVFSPFNQFVISGSVDRTIRIWDLKTGEAVQTLNNSLAVSAVTLSPNGNFIYSTGPAYKPSVKIWQRSTGQLKQVINDFKAVVRALDVSSDGNVLATAVLDGNIELWDTATGDRLRTLTGHTDVVTAVAFAPGGRTLVSGGGGRDRTVRIWNADKATLLHTMTDHKDWVLDVAVSNNGRYVVSASADRTLKLWELDSGKLIRTFSGHSNWARSVAISPDNDRIVSGSKDGTVKVWDLKTGALLYDIKATTKGIDEVRDVAFASDNKTVMAGVTDGLVKIWTLEER